MSTECNKLHEIVNNLEIRSYPFSSSGIPKNGIYIMFENGEAAHHGFRIVRIGINVGQDNLYQRLTEHYEKRNKDRSIFRKNIGLALLNGREDPFLNKWKIDLTTHDARLKYSEIVNSETLLNTEKEVSEIIQRNFKFSLIQVDSKLERKKLEARLISTVSHCKECGPSDQWLGLKSPKKKIRESGLWQEQGMNEQVIDQKTLEKIEEELL